MLYRSVTLLTCIIFFSGCASNSRIQSMSWYQDLNPATTETTSDWELFDLDVNSMKKMKATGSDIWAETVNTIWE